MNWSCDNPTAIYSSLLIWSLINWNSNSSSVTFLWEKATWQFFVSIQFGGVPKHPFQDQCYDIEFDWGYRFRLEFLNSENCDWKVIYLVLFRSEFCRWLRNSLNSFLSWGHLIFFQLSFAPSYADLLHIFLPITSQHLNFEWSALLWLVDRSGEGRRYLKNGAKFWINWAFSLTLVLPCLCHSRRKN